MAPLVQELGNKIPAEFQLPQDIRSFFKDGQYRCCFMIFTSLKPCMQLELGPEAHIRTYPRSSRLVSSEITFFHSSSSFDIAPAAVSVNWKTAIRTD